MSEIQNLLEVLPQGNSLAQSFKAFVTSTSQFCQNLLSAFGVNVSSNVAMGLTILIAGIALSGFYENGKYLLGALVLIIVGHFMGFI